jgi:hypothetical protein
MAPETDRNSSRRRATLSEEPARQLRLAVHTLPIAVPDSGVYHPSGVRPGRLERRDHGTGLPDQDDIVRLTVERPHADAPDALRKFGEGAGGDARRTEADRALPADRHHSRPQLRVTGGHNPGSVPALREPGEDQARGIHVARALASYALLQGSTGARYDGGTKTLYLAPSLQADFRSFLSTATGYGTVGVRAGKPFVEVVHGRIEVSKVVGGVSKPSGEV